ncbi:family 79 glycoside hydrolase [Rhizodiscina lignyota]|uniref:Family 79 glycoside hydrolase n=1 Tax=Rhizodiscina lignyota TaxID=1504668 RepID=A0A9P4IF48_9PEZI|nr:family 79 glycoside hydrolase [Rhizodiscina lignyota]
MFKSALLSTVFNTLFAVCEIIPLVVQTTPPASASTIVPLDFLSYSIEFSFWGDYAGFNATNEFTNNLIGNLKTETGQDLIIRVGGATQDRTTYIASQKQPIINNWDYTYNLDQPKNSTIGPSFWRSFNRLSSTKYIFGLNFFKNDSTFMQNLYGEVSESRKNIPTEKLYLFELGNENDVGTGNGFRPANWTQKDYVNEWVYRTEHLQSKNNDKLRFYAPSFAGLGNDVFSPITVWNSTYDYDQDGWIAEVSQHGYVTFATRNPTLASDIMNHTTTSRFVAPFVNLNNFHTSHGRIFTIGETNSVAGQGAFNVSDVFGSALWGIDFSLLSAANNITRLHFHQGTAYRYASWQPVTVNGTAPLTKPPYYGNIFVARFIGSSNNTQIMNYPLDGESNVAYAAYDGGKLARMAFLNMDIYNLTASAGAPKPSNTFVFNAPSWATSAEVTKLTAPEATSNTTITFGGYSYDYNLAKGRPVKVSNGTSMIMPNNGVFSVEVAASEAVIVALQ